MTHAVAISRPPQPSKGHAPNSLARAREGRGPLCSHAGTEWYSRLADPFFPVINAIVLIGLLPSIYTLIWERRSRAASPTTERESN